MSLTSLRFLLLVILCASPLAVRGEEVLSYVFDRAVSDNDVRHEYFWRVIHEALEVTRPEYGDYNLKSSRLTHEQHRMQALEHGLSDINLTIAPYRPELDGRLIVVHIPVDRGMLGYRVLLIRKAEQERFDKIKKGEDLRGLHFGSLESWVAGQILRRADLEVVDGTSYEGLFRMLAGKRFDALDRGAVEIVPEYEHYGAELPDIAIEQHVALHYPMGDYLWFTNTDEGRRRAERLELGLNRMIANGSLQKMFDEEFGDALRRLDFVHRRIIELPDPFADPQSSLVNPSFWYRPGDSGKPLSSR